MSAFGIGTSSAIGCIRWGRIRSMMARQRYCVASSPTPEPGVTSGIARIEQLTAFPCANGPAPAFDCSCGIYATRNLRDPGRVWRSGPQYANHVVGAVTLWGRVVEHEWGYRAEHARPVALLEGFGVQTVADAYRVPVLSADELLSGFGEA